MAGCEQAPGLNMLQHGELVHAKYKELLADVESGNAPYSGLATLLQYCELPDTSELAQYHIYHDCGKHLTLSVDENGKKHFPDHANVSANQYAHLFPEDTFTTTLIRRDMDFHTLRGDDIAELCNDPLAPILYFTAWAELEANASMFGGRESQSYKIKAKRLIQAGKKLITALHLSQPVAA